MTGRRDSVPLECDDCGETHTGEALERTGGDCPNVRETHELEIDGKPITVRIMAPPTPRRPREARPDEVYSGYTETELKAAIDEVSDPSDWRGPIDAIVEGETGVYEAAIAYYTATSADVSLVRGRKGASRIRSRGYRNGPAGS